MASSFIEYQNNGFWIRDGILEPAASYLYLQMLNHSPQEQWLTEVGEHIKHNSWGYFKGFMDFGLDENLIDDHRKNLFLQIIDNAINDLKSKPEILDILKDLSDVLDEENKRIYSGPGDITRDRIITVLQLLRKVVNGEKVDDSPRSDSMMI